MNLTCENYDDATVVKFENPRLDAAIAVSFKDKFREFSRASTGPIILDMANVEFMDSSGLGAIVAVYKMIAKERVFCLAGATSAVMRVFQLTRMDSVFGIHPTVEEARASVNGGQIAGSAA